MRRRRRAGALRAGAWLLLCCAGLGCATSLDLDRARRALRLPERPATPELTEAPAAELPAPEGLRALVGELRAVPLKWDPLLAGDVGGYLVERAPGPEGPFGRALVVPQRMHTVAVDRGDSAPPDLAGGDGFLPDGITLYYRVRAWDGSGRLGPPSPVVAATTAPAPRPPEDLRAYSLQPRQVPLSWRASEDSRVASYVVYRGPTARGPFEPLTEIADRYQTVYLDRGLGDLRVFYYRVGTRNEAGGEGELSPAVRAVTKPEPLPPMGLRVVEQRLGTNRLAWDPNVETDIAEYRLLRRRGDEASGRLVAALSTGQTTAEDGAVGADERVSYSVVAVDRDGLASAPSSIAVVSQGYGLSAAARPDGVHLRWTPRPEEGFRGARVMRAGRFGPRRLGFSEGPGFVDAAVLAGRAYRYFVVFERADGSEAPPSSVVEIALPGR